MTAGFLKTLVLIVERNQVCSATPRQLVRGEGNTEVALSVRWKCDDGAVGCAQEH